VIKLPYPPTINHYYGQARNNRKYIKAAGVEFRAIVKRILVDAQAEIIDAPCVLKSLILVGKDKRRRDNDNAKKSLFDAIMTAGFLIDDSLIYQYKNVSKSKDGKVMHDLDKKGFCLVEFEKIKGATGGFVGVRASDFEIDNKLI
jgi:crossover junction endodeoxyribonuclease RusA